MFTTALGKRRKPSPSTTPPRWPLGAKNDHLGFEVIYIHRGVVRKYRPDFLVRLRPGAMLVLETKGRDSDQDRTKRRFLDEWTRAINAHGGFGHWSWDVSSDPGDIQDILARHARTDAV